MSDADDDLEWEPVIGTIPITHPTLKVTFDGWNLYINDALYAEDVARLLPVLTAKGLISKNHRPPTDKRPATWWKAQCAFRGLPVAGTIEQLQKQLRGHEKDPITQDIVDLKARARKEYRIKNDAHVEDKWKNTMSGDEKVVADPRRYLTEVFADNGGPQAMLVKGHKTDGVEHHGFMQALAKELNVESEVIEAPKEKDPKIAPYVWQVRKWVVIGRSKEAVAKMAEPVKKESAKEREAERERDAAFKRRKEMMEQKEKARVQAALVSCDDWDVTGTYTLTCPEMEDDYGLKGCLKLEIFWKQTAKGPSMFAKFDFGLVKGFFRFERQAAASKPASAQQDAGKKRKRTDSDDGESDNDSDYDRYRERSRSPTPDAFYLGSVSKPSATYPTWNYRWRGEEEGQCGSYLGTDKRLYKITFFGPRVERLEGTFGCDLFVHVTFTGVKTAASSGREDFDLAHEWAEANEFAKLRESRGY